MRQLCPYCGKLVDLPEDAPGREVPCPLCAKSFAVPKSYTPNVGPSVGPNPAEVARPAAPPPGLVVPSLPSVAVTPQGPPSIPSDLRDCGVTLNPKVLSWVPAIGLTVALIVSLFFSATVSYPGGYRVFAQSPVQALFASVSSNSVATVQDAEKVIRDTIKSNWLMLFYFLGLILAVAIAWLVRLYPNPTLQSVPAPLGWLVRFWTKRHVVLVTLAAGTLFLIVQQNYRGFGLETAIVNHAAQPLVKELEAADSSFKKQEVEIRIGQEIGKYCLGGTLAFDLGLLAHALAVLALLIVWWLDRRGDKPAPRWVLRY